jgi:hypothetical protein
MVPLPAELWLTIFDIVIEEGIIRLDQCDCIKLFPYIQPLLSAKRHRNRFFGSYRRLRLVCRRFYAILRDSPYRTCQLSIFPLSTAVRALFLDLETLLKPNFDPLFAKMLASERLICLDVTCGLSPNPDRPNLPDFFRVTARQALRHIERLTLRLSSEPNSQYVDPFWPRLHDSFPLLVTLFIIEAHGHSGESALLRGDGGEVVFERLEILYFNSAVSHVRCNFPRLRHLSMFSVFPDELQGLADHSPNLESLLIRSDLIGSRIDVTLFPSLKLLGLPDKYIMFAPVGCDHPLEHIWLYLTAFHIEHSLIEQLAKELPNMSRITVNILLPTWQLCMKRAEEYRRVNFESIGFRTRPIMYGETHIIIQKIPKDL